jgi:phosphoglycerate dehydrogenase-like enzyme
VAEATIGWLIALSHNLRIKDGLVRTGQWDERSKHMGRELRDRTLGVIGLGGIARKVIELLRGFGMNQPLAFDPFVNEEEAAKIGSRLVSLEELLRQADFVSIHCPLTLKTLGLIGARELALMKPDAYLLNTARGGIVDEDALYQTLKNRQIAGAALDCFAEEPSLPRIASAIWITCCSHRTASRGPKSCSGTSDAPRSKGWWIFPSGRSRAVC